MKKPRPILQILADRLGVYEVGIQTQADEYDKAEQLSAAIKPAIEIIEDAVRDICAVSRNQLRPYQSREGSGGDRN